jgi:hypothetical protein
VKTYRVTVKAEVAMVYEVEADSKEEAKAEAVALCESGDNPVEFATTSAKAGFAERVDC